MDISAEYEIVRFVEPLELFGCGELLLVRCGDVQFTGYLQSWQEDPVREDREVIAARYPAGTRLLLEAELTQNDDDPQPVPEGTPPGIHPQRRPPESEAHDVVVVGTVIDHDADEGEVVLDCGILVRMEWSGPPPPRIGQLVRKVGDLWLLRADRVLTPCGWAPAAGRR